MSFRELRDFTETLRLLRYPRQISIESFRKPNFELVADVLYWLTLRLDPSATITFQMERERDRINFLRQCSDVVGNKGRLRLNMRRVYQADGYAVRELAKIANVLRDAMNSIDITNLESTVDDIALTQLVSQVTSTSAENRIQDAKALRQLTSEITQTGSALYALYGAENTMRARRTKVVNKHTDMADVERHLRELHASITSRTESGSDTLTNLQADEKNLEQKMDSKRAQLERQQKRLKALQAVRPAFMEEYEKQEMELQRQYAVYLEQYRNLEYLENELSKCTKLEDTLLTEQEVKLRMLREKLRKEELKVLRGEAVENAQGDIDIMDTTEGGMSDAALEMARQAAADHGAHGFTEGSSRPRAASGRQRPSTKDGPPGRPSAGPPKEEVKAKGNIYGGGDDDSESDLDDLDEDDDDDDGNISGGDDDDGNDSAISGSDEDGGGGDDDDADSNDS